MINLNWQPGMTLDAIEKQAILQAFRFYRGNKTATSNALGIAIRTLDNKLEKYALDERAQDKAEFEANERQSKFNELQKHGRAGHRLGDAEKSAPKPGPELTTTGPDWEKIQRDGWGPNGPPSITLDKGDKSQDAKGAETVRENGSGAQAGNGVEPTAEVAAQHAVPVRERTEVQSVPPAVAAGSNSARRRG